MKKNYFLYISILVFILFTISLSQSSKLYIPRNIQSAYDNNTRSLDGTPGENYWQNRADYDISVDLDPTTLLISGTEIVTYTNNSPDTLRELVMHLFPNIYKKSVPREEKVYPMDETDGVMIKSLHINGQKFNDPASEDYSGYIIEETLMYVFHQMLPGEKVKMEIDWQTSINRYSHIRSGMVDSTSFFIAYFFPRIAVYDDIDGWNQFYYTGTSEFYNDFGNFTLNVTIPKDFVVWATGLLQNPDEVLMHKFAECYKQALSSDKIIQIIDSSECTSGTVTQANEKNTWTFKAENVTDVAFGTSDHYLWDASSLIVDAKTKRRTLIDAAYDKNSEDFFGVASLAREAIKNMSFEFPGIPFPFPQETVFNGLSEMEYPMMVNDFSTKDPHYLIKLTSHEIFHSYFPFYTGLNETKYAWMDEGLTSYGEYRTVYDIDSPEEANFYFYNSYKRFIGHDWDLPIMVNSDYIKPPLYDFNSYVKPAVFFMTLNHELGDKLFKKSLQIFAERWQGKHPTPWDFFFTFMDITGENLDWLIKPWFFEYGYMDLAVQKINSKNNNHEIVIEKKGHYPGPICLKVKFTDSSEKIIEKKAAIWKDGKQFYTIKLKSENKVISAELVNKFYLDADLENNKIRLDKNKMELY